MPKKPNKLPRILLLLLLVLSLGGCYSVGTILAIDKTLPETPKLNLAPYWVFETAYSLDPDHLEIDLEYFKGLGAYLSTDRIIIGTDSVENPEMKAMRIKTYEYFLTRYQIEPSDVGLEIDSLEAYTVTDAKGFSVRIYKISEESIAIERNSILMMFRQTDKLSDTNIRMDPNVTDGPTTRPASNASGVLIALRGRRSEDKDGVPGEAPYRTLWISRERGKAPEVYEMQDILFPRDEFYLMEIRRQENIDVVQETIVIRELDGDDLVRESAPERTVSRLSDITFISSDYFSTITGLYRGRNLRSMQYYTTRNVDRPDFEARVDISDFFGPEGINVMESAAKAALASAEPDETAGLDELGENSFILKRFNGRWTYEGRINARERFSDKNVTFSMNLRDNYRVYRYDSLTPRWSDIRTMVPEAVDAVSSPEDLFTAVLTDNELLIYARTESGALGPEPMARVDTNNEEIIMHEWAMGSVVEEWTKVVRPLGRKIR